MNARHTRPTYGKRYYKSPRGSNREVDLQPYRRFFGALLLQQVLLLSTSSDTFTSKLTENVVWSVGSVIVEGGG